MFNTHQEYKLVELLKERGLTISCAESCTAGLVASMIGNVPGASDVFNESYVTYSNDAKIKNLKVKEETLKEHGAVSHQTAKEMAEGVKKCSEADIGVSVTGIAGPTGGTVSKPVGLVYIGIATNKGCTVYKYHFTGSRNLVRNKTARSVLRKVIQMIKEDK